MSWQEHAALILCGAGLIIAVVLIQDLDKRVKALRRQLYSTEPGSFESRLDDTRRMRTQTEGQFRAVNRSLEQLQAFADHMGDRVMVTEEHLVAFQEHADLWADTGITPETAYAVSGLPGRLDKLEHSMRLAEKHQHLDSADKWTSTPEVRQPQASNLTFDRVGDTIRAFPKARFPTPAANAVPVTDPVTGVVVRTWGTGNLSQVLQFEIPDRILRDSRRDLVREIFDAWLREMTP